MILRPVALDDAVPADVRALRIDLDLGLPLDDPAFDALSAEERAAAARFRRHADAVRSAGTRAALRAAIGAELGIPPAALRFARSPRGRPSLDVGATPPLDFNVAHGGDHALLAWSRLRRVGVDIEPARVGWDWRPLCPAVLGEIDAHHLAEAPGEARAALFFDIWTAKEALLKADGRGIAEGLGAFSVLSGDPDHPCVAGASPLAGDLLRFASRWLRGLPGHAACLAWSRAPG